MQDPKQMLADYLNCSVEEIDMLLHTEIELGKVTEFTKIFHPYIDDVYLGGFEMRMKEIFGFCMFEEVYVSYGGINDTHLYIRPGLRDKYESIKVNGLAEVEQYLNLKLEDRWF